MDKGELIQMVAASMGALGVAAGAFGAHALRSRLEASGRAGTWDTAVRYHLIHALALMLVAFSAQLPGSIVDMTTLASVSFTVGIVLFSGSLYGLALGGPRWLGPVTPLGGLALIAGWLFLGLC